MGSGLAVGAGIKESAVSIVGEGPSSWERLSGRHEALTSTKTGSRRGTSAGAADRTGSAHFWALGALDRRAGQLPVTSAHQAFPLAEGSQVGRVTAGAHVVPDAAVVA